MKFWDANASFGPVRVPVPGASYTLTALTEKMNAFGIDKALVYHSLAKEYDPAFGNGALLDALNGDARFLPVFALLPDATGEMDAPDALLDQMKKSGVRAAVLFPAPGCQNFSLRRWSIGPMLDALSERRVPVLLGLDQFGGNLEAMGDFALCYPRLRLIATGLNFRADRMLYPLMDKLPNLYVETSCYKPFRGVSDFCRRFGAKRLLFGSGMPAIDPAASVGLITYADISPADKEDVAHGNLERLLKEAE